MSKLRLNQVLATERPAKSDAEKELASSYHVIQKTEPFNGISRVYTPVDDDGDKLPSESKHVQVTVEDLIDLLLKSQTKYFDITATKDFANTKAVADVVIDGEVLIEKAPTTFLLWLENRVSEFLPFVVALPTYDTAEKWEWDEGLRAYRTAPVESVKTKKVPKNHIKYEATDKHPAQVEIFTEDVAVGSWNTTRYSGAISPARKNEIIERFRKLRDAVKVAIQEANATEAEQKEVGAKIFGYLFAR